jgi:hypothetical protein
MQFTPSKEFFGLLYDDPEFCQHVGQVMLAAGMLETNLRIYLQNKSISGVRANSTLGSLVKTLEKNDLLSKNGLIHFKDLAKKRNYLSHSLYDLFTEVIEETILSRKDLTEGDVYFFTEKAWILANDFTSFAGIVAKADMKKEFLL